MNKKMNVHINFKTSILIMFLLAAYNIYAVSKDPYSGSRIFWDTDSELTLFPSGNYARIIQLQDGRIMAAAESGGGISVCYSSNYGKTWTSPELIVRQQSLIPYAVPDLIQLTDGTILVGFNPRPSSPYSENRKFGIRTIISHDNYQQPGTYKVVCVATNHTDAGNSIKRDTCSFMVKVIDDVTEIERLSAPQVIYDEVFANPVNETDWLLRLPRKIKFKTSNATVSLSQKLKFYIGSDSTKVYIDDKEFSSTAKYNLANVLNIKLKSHEGTERPYKLYTVNYGEFKTFELLGVQGTITRSEFDYSYYEINMTVPSGSDLSNLAPTFTLYSDNDKVYIDDVEQISGTTTADFTKPVTYRFVASYPNRPDITAESTVIVTVTPQ